MGGGDMIVLLLAAILVTMLGAWPVVGVVLGVGLGMWLVLKLVVVVSLALEPVMVAMWRVLLWLGILLTKRTEKKKKDHEKLPPN